MKRPIYVVVDYDEGNDVVGLFSNEEMAKRYCIEGGFAGDVDEYIMDIPPAKWWGTSMIIDRTGTVAGISKVFCRGRPVELPNGSYSKDNETMWVYVPTGDEKRAVRIAKKKHAQIIALGIWGDRSQLKKVFPHPYD